MKMSEYYQQRADEQRWIANYYGRCPEDQQKAAGRQEALAEAERYDALAAEALAEEAAEKAAREAEYDTAIQDANEHHALRFEKRGCNFFPGDTDAIESDIGNYRIDTATRVPLADGRLMFFEFTCYDSYRTRTTNKRTGAPLKKPVRELVMTCCASIDTEYTDADGNHWRALPLENDFRATPRKYTEANILSYINSIAAVHYDHIEYVLNVDKEG